MPIGSNCEICNTPPQVITSGEFQGQKHMFDYCVHCSKDLCASCMTGACNQSPSKTHQSSEDFATEHESKSYPHELSCMECRNNSVCCHCGKFIERKNRCTNGRCKECCVKNCKHVVG